MDATFGTLHEAPPALNWPALWRRLATYCRDLRRLCGLSQDQLAKRAGISQGAVSRLESGRLESFPVTTVTQVFATLARATDGLDAAIPADMLTPVSLVRSLLPALETVPAPPLEPELAELVRLYHLVPRPYHHVLLDVMRPLAQHLSAWQR